MGNFPPARFVSSHAPVRGHLLAAVFAGIIRCFKSCPREGASKMTRQSVPRFWVSSHAPVRGHRVTATPDRGDMRVSSHAPVRGHHWENELVSRSA